MGRRESDRETDQMRKIHEKRVQDRRRRRRKKKLIRAVLIMIILVTLGFTAVGICLLGKSLLGGSADENLKLPWTFGTVDIVLDAGHGGKDQGASAGDVIEKDITLRITEKTKDILEEAGYKVGMVREEDTFVKLEERAEYANKRQAKIFVSIHCNSSEGEGNGIETFYAESKAENSQALAELIQQKLIEQTDACDREAKTANYAVIVGTQMPAVLVEAGFLSDADERELLQKEEYQKKIAKGIAAGILEYLEKKE